MIRILLLAILVVVISGCNSAQIKPINPDSPQIVGRYEQLSNTNRVAILIAPITKDKQVIGKQYKVYSLSQEIKCVKVKVLHSSNYFPLFFDKKIVPEKMVVIGRSYIENHNRPYSYKFQYMILNESKCKTT